MFGMCVLFTDHTFLQGTYILFLTTRQLVVLLIMTLANVTGGTPSSYQGQTRICILYPRTLAIKTLVLTLNLNLTA